MTTSVGTPPIKEAVEEFLSALKEGITGNLARHHSLEQLRSVSGLIPGFPDPLIRARQEVRSSASGWKVVTFFLDTGQALETGWFLDERLDDNATSIIRYWRLVQVTGKIS